MMYFENTWKHFYWLKTNFQNKNDVYTISNNKSGQEITWWQAVDVSQSHTDFWADEVDIWEILFSLWVFSRLENQFR